MLHIKTSCPSVFPQVALLIVCRTSSDPLLSFTLLSQEMIVSIKRHLQNTFQDHEKQDAMNLFLGYFIPYATELTLPLQMPLTSDDSGGKARSSSISISAGAADAPTRINIWDLGSDFYLHNSRVDTSKPVVAMCR